MQTSWPASKPLLGYMLYGITGTLQNISNYKKGKIKYLGGCKEESIFKCHTAKAATATATLQPMQRPTAIPHLEGKIRYIGALSFRQLTHQSPSVCCANGIRHMSPSILNAEHFDCRFRKQGCHSTEQTVAT